MTGEPGIQCEAQERVITVVVVKHSAEERVLISCCYYGLQGDAALHPSGVSQLLQRSNHHRGKWGVGMGFHRMLQSMLHWCHICTVFLFH